jgi:hypothetical protein
MRWHTPKRAQATVTDHLEKCISSQNFSLDWWTLWLKKNNMLSVIYEGPCPPLQTYLAPFSSLLCFKFSLFSSLWSPCTEAPSTVSSILPPPTWLVSPYSVVFSLSVASFGKVSIESTLSVLHISYHSPSQHSCNPLLSASRLREGLLLPPLCCTPTAQFCAWSTNTYWVSK